jgi:hypothetical protein
MRKCGKTLYRRAGRVRQYNTAHGNCVLDTKGYKHTLRIYNTYCFSTSTVVALTRLKVSYTHISRLVSMLKGFNCSWLKFPTKKVTKATVNVPTHMSFPYPVTNCRYSTIQPVFISENYPSKLMGDHFSKFHLPSPSECSDIRIDNHSRLFNSDSTPISLCPKQTQKPSYLRRYYMLFCSPFK